MPTINVDQQYLFEALGKKYTTEEFRELCFEFGIELEEDTSEFEMAVNQMGEAAAKAKGFSNRPIYKIDVPANRYDLLCQEGIVLALKIFLGLAVPPTFQLIRPKSGNLKKIFVKPETATIRPYVVGAILRNIKFNEQSYESFISLQEKLHHTVCRKRSLVAIGTHDFNTLQGPFTYEARPPSSIRFQPLNEPNEMDAQTLTQYYRDHSKHVAKYLPLIESSPVYPVIYDAQSRVCSLPPIINSDHSKISMNTSTIFIECTATDRHRATIVLTILVTLFSMYTTPSFAIEPMEVHYPDGSIWITPDWLSSPKTLTLDLNTTNETIGIDLTLSQLTNLLTRMGLQTTSSLSSSSSLETQTQVEVILPFTRPDILHARDLIEDVAVAYGYSNIPKTLPKVMTMGRPFPLNQLSDQVRYVLAMLGYTEVLPLTLCSLDEAYTYLNHHIPECILLPSTSSTTTTSTPSSSSSLFPLTVSPAVVLSHPKTLAYEIVRPSLIPGLLTTLVEHQHSKLPLKLFEVGDSVLLNPDASTYTKNQRRVGCVYMDTVSAFQSVQGILESLIQALVPNSSSSKVTSKCLELKENSDPMFFKDRGASIWYQDQPIGILGVLHPNVLHHFKLSMPVTLFEVTLEPFL